MYLTHWKKLSKKIIIDFYLIGAQARDQWYAKANLVARQTNDVDFAVYVGVAADYKKVREYLKDHFYYTETKQNQFVLLAPSGLQVDIYLLETLKWTML